MENTEKKVVEEQQKSARTPEIISRAKLLEAGTYFGRRPSAWNPKMKPYIYGKRNGNHIIDVTKTQKSLEYAFKMIQKASAKGAKFIFVGTKKQAKSIIEEQANRTNSPYVSERWLGGTLTNQQTIFKSVDLLESLEKKQAEGYVGYTKKEGLDFDKKISKLQKNLNGIRNMRYTPNIMIVASPLVDDIAIKEARKKGIKVFGILNSNADPDNVDFGIPANDASVKSITLILTVLADAIASGRNEKQLFAYQPDEAVVLPEDVRKESSDQPRRVYNRKPRVENSENKGE
ncbi:30S ribosomal protein S2 [Mycoplasma phocoenae]|uniref:Small ribosomal subunit protein uS2 n=1 Tax=Mycoplasma phocoenae TaxID=754517 RepID=A0A858U4T1_9MOLU|nr:30S ribosomal protein S2 [Mycoplasma phocoenae]QJG67051.1 30S ribosomal protein S2 [Mycoplasma phocoenae]